ncbi:hypothetical protein B7463_g11825, partial [Scytalidium lignicola]
MSCLSPIPEGAQPTLQEQESSFNQLYMDNIIMQQELQIAIDRYNASRVYLAHVGVDLQVPEWVDDLKPLLNSLSSQAGLYKSAVDAALIDSKCYTTTVSDFAANQTTKDAKEEPPQSPSRTSEELIAFIVENTAHIADRNRSMRHLTERFHKTSQIFTRDAERQRNADKRKNNLAAKRAMIANNSVEAWKRVEKLIAEKAEAEKVAAEKAAVADKALTEKKAEKEREVEEKRVQLKKAMQQEKTAKLVQIKKQSETAGEIINVDEALSELKLEDIF